MVKSVYRMRNNQHSNRQLKVTTTPTEAVKEIGKGVVRSVQEDLVGGVASEFVRQLLGPTPKDKERVKKPREERVESRRTVLVPEHTLYLDRDHRESREIQYRTRLILEEIRRITKETRGIEKQLENIAVEEPPKEPRIYHLFFFGWILKLLRKAREMIYDAAFWLSVWETKKQKKGLLAGYGYGKGKKSITACIQRMLGSEMGVARSGT